ncbi:MAG: PadR family transcriptional regulator [Chloroflexi bacterium]|nr:PadR family transcriptional regulator [Chloroflexota bacterium]
MSLKFGILGLLAQQPLHGYEVKTRYEALFGGTRELNIGQVYTTLQRLERDGLIGEVGERGDRGKQRYGLTDAGEAALQEWLQEPEEEPQQLRQDIYLKLLLISRLANGNLDGLLSRQRRVYLQRLKDLGDLERRARRDGRGDLVLLIQGAILHTEADLKWIDVCAEESREAAHDTGGNVR